MRRSVGLAVGAYLPKRIITNDELARRIDTTDEWITQRTGIRQRHVAADGEMTSDLAVKAAEQALHQAGLRGADIDARAGSIVGRQAVIRVARHRHGSTKRERYPVVRDVILLLMQVIQGQRRGFS